jgi:(p)ppGpp synthase/HD superfamily hydrolase
VNEGEPTLDPNLRHELLPAYTPRLDAAVALVMRDFRRVTRKGSRVPYISHLFSVTALVAEAGGDEDQLVAAMLHDWLEDVPGATGAALEERFGPRVLRIVLACTDTQESPKPAWRPRKEQFIASLRHAREDERLVCCADKVHNLQTLVRDLRSQGPATLDRFRGGREGTLWYYREVTDALGSGWDHWLLGELRSTLHAAQALAG